jgi:hypothetical protein
MGDLRRVQFSKASCFILNQGVKVRGRAFLILMGKEGYYAM